MTKTTTYTDCELTRAWHHGNDRAEGFPVGEETDSPKEAATREGYTDITEISDQDNSVSATDGDGNTIVVCDANGPWAVDVSIDAAEYAAEVGAEKYWDTVSEDRYYDRHGRYPR